MNLGAFWARRARRLLPAMLVVVGVVAVYARWWANPLELKAIRGDGLATLGYVANWQQLAGDANYWDTISAPSPLLHTWSLAIEEQFYLVWPLVFALFVLPSRWYRGRDRGLTPLLIVTSALAVASAIAMVVLHGAGDSSLRVYLGTDTRAAALLFGVLVALLFARRDQPVGARTARALDVAGVVALAGLAVAWVATNGQDGWLYEGGFALCSAAGALAVAAVWARPSGILARPLTWSPLRFLGLISYGLYLWHWPVIVIATPLRTGLDGLRLDAFRVALSLGLATASYHLLEMPIRRGTLLRGRPAWAGALGVPVLCVVAVVTATVARPTPFTREVELAARHPDRLVEAEDDPAVVVPTTQAAPRQEPDEAAPPGTILVVGDSGAYFLGKGMTTVGNGRGVAVYSRGIIGCSIGRVPGTVRVTDGRIVTRPAECDRVMDRWRFFLGLTRPDLVLLTLAWPGGDETEVDGQWRSDCDPEHDAHLQQVLVEELEVLKSTGARTAATTIPYRISPYDPNAGRDATDCRNKALKAASAATHTRVVDLAAWACPDGECDVDRDGVALRPDLVHFAGPGAEVAGGWLLDQLTGRG